MSWSPWYCNGRVVFAAANLSFAIILSTSTSFAQTPQQRNSCLGRDNAPAATRLQSCVAVIEAGRDPASTMSVAYMVRGDGYRLKGEFPPALEDYAKSIELDGRQAGAFYGRGLIYKDKAEYEKALDCYRKNKDEDKFTECSEMIRQLRRVCASS